MVQLLNLNNGKNLGYRITRGQGPNDMIMPKFINGEKYYGTFSRMTYTLLTSKCKKSITTEDMVVTQY